MISSAQDAESGALLLNLEGSNLSHFSVACFDFGVQLDLVGLMRAEKLRSFRLGASEVTFLRSRQAALSGPPLWWQNVVIASWENMCHDASLSADLQQIGLICLVEAGISWTPKFRSLSFPYNLCSSAAALNGDNANTEAPPLFQEAEIHTKAWRMWAQQRSRDSEDSSEGSELYMAQAQAQESWCSITGMFRHFYKFVDDV